MERPYEIHRSVHNYLNDLPVSRLFWQKLIRTVEGEPAKLHLRGAGVVLTGRTPVTSVRLNRSSGVTLDPLVVAPLLTTKARPAHTAPEGLSEGHLGCARPAPALVDQPAARRLPRQPRRLPVRGKRLEAPPCRSAGGHLSGDTGTIANEFAFACAQSLLYECFWWTMLRLAIHC